MDAIIDAVGSEEIINSVLPLIKMGGSICVYGVVGENTITLVKSVGPYNFNLLVHQWPTRIYESAAQEPLCRWITEDKLDYRDFLTAEFPVNDFTKAIELLDSRQATKIFLRY